MVRKLLMSEHCFKLCVANSHVGANVSLHTIKHASHGSSLCLTIVSNYVKWSMIKLLKSNWNGENEVDIRMLFKMLTRKLEGINPTAIVHSITVWGWCLKPLLYWCLSVQGWLYMIDSEEIV